VTALAWHNDPQLKADTVAAMIRDREADAIVHGVYQNLDPEKAVGFRGCAIGCLVAAKRDPLTAPSRRDGWVDEPEPSWHLEVARLYNIPPWIAREIDDVFEGLPTGDNAHARFAVEVIEAIPTGADLWRLPEDFSSEEYEEPEDAAAALIALLRSAPVVEPAL